MARINRMDFEAIMFRAAKDAAEGTKYYWVDLLDNTQQYEARAWKLNESEMYDYWLRIFKDSIAALEWSDEEAE